MSVRNMCKGVCGLLMDATNKFDDQYLHWFVRVTCRGYMEIKENVGASEVVELPEEGQINWR